MGSAFTQQSVLVCVCARVHTDTTPTTTTQQTDFPRVEAHALHQLAQGDGRRLPVRVMFTVCVFWGRFLWSSFVAVAGSNAVAHTHHTRAHTPTAPSSPPLDSPHRTLLASAHTHPATPLFPRTRPHAPPTSPPSLPSSFLYGQPHSFPSLSPLYEKRDALLRRLGPEPTGRRQARRQGRAHPVRQVLEGRGLSMVCAHAVRYRQCGRGAGGLGRVIVPG